jgi:hypothetical protein
MTTPLFIHANLSKLFVLETDIFDFVIGVVLSQLKEYNFFHLVNFHFCNFFLAQINYKIHDKKFITIMNAFEKWHHLFENFQNEITMNSDHKNL